MFGFLDWAKIGGGVAIGAALAFGPVYFYGKSIGRQDAAVEALEKSVTDLRKRNTIDEVISNSDATVLCGDLGLPKDDERECVRRLEEASAKPGNVGGYTQSRPPVR